MVILLNKQIKQSDDLQKVMNMKRLSENHKSVLLRVVLPEDLRVKLDEKRGNVPASAFVRDLILKAIND